MTAPQSAPFGIVAPAYTWGRGYAQLSSVPQPAAGAAAKLTIPGTAYQRLLSAHFTLTTSAAVANRFPRVSLLDGDGVVRGRFASSVAVVAGSVATYTFAVGLGDHSHVATGDGYSAIPDMILPPGFAWQFDAAGLDVLDQLSAVDTLLDWFWTGPMGPAQGMQANSRMGAADPADSSSYGATAG